MNMSLKERLSDVRSEAFPDVKETAISGLNAYSNSPTSLGYATLLYASVDAGSDVAYKWELGDGHQASGSSVHHMYPHPGEFMATVTASNAFGMMTATTFVIVDETDIWDLG